MVTKAYANSAAIFVFLVPIVSHAQVEITEIMYDLEGGDAGREWVEIRNAGTDPLDLSDWKLFENDTNHGLTLSQGSETVPPGGYAVIADNPAKFLADWTYQGTLFDSAFSLNNTGEQLVLRCCGKELNDRDSVAYSSDAGAVGDGSSLHRSGSAFMPGAPSPGSGAFEVKKTAQAEPISEPPPAPPKAPVIENKTVSPQVEPVPVTVSDEASEPKSVDQVSQPPNSIPVATLVPAAVPVTRKEEPPSPQVAIQKPKQQRKVVVREDEEEAVPDVAVTSDEESVGEASAVVTEAQTAAVAHAAGPGWEWYAGAALTTLIGAFGAYVAGRMRKTEWEIEEIE